MTISLINENRLKTDGFLTDCTPKNNTILLIGNDQKLSDLFQHQLYDHGYQVSHEYIVDTSIINSISKNKPYLVILDIGFSNLAMLKVITQIRTIFSGPLVLLTSRDSEQEQISAFTLGVDEYLVKPVSENILNVRVDALFRRYSKKILTEEQTEIRLGNYTLFPCSYKCYLGEKNIPLTRFEFKLIWLLADNIGTIMSRDFIYTNLLGREYNGSERTVDVRVSQLRDKLTKNSQSKLHIETVWGQGYMLF